MVRRIAWAMAWATCLATMTATPARSQETFHECQAGQVSDDDGVTLLENACSLTLNDQIWHDAQLGPAPPAHDFCRETQAVGCDLEAECIGLCGPGCGALFGFGIYALDCAEHDRCCGVHGGCFNPIDPNCGDEFTDAADDFLFGSVDCVLGCEESSVPAIPTGSRTGLLAMLFLGIGISSVSLAARKAHRQNKLRIGDVRP